MARNYRADILLKIQALQIILLKKIMLIIFRSSKIKIVGRLYNEALFGRNVAKARKFYCILYQHCRFTNK